MLTRTTVQPSLSNLIKVRTVFDQEFEVRYLLGNKSYEGWYIPSLRKIMPQKELRVKEYTDEKGQWKRYIPKKEVDYIFSKEPELEQADYNAEKLCYEFTH